VSREDREKAKRVAYGLCYGQTAWGLAQGSGALGISVAAAQVGGWVAGWLASRLAAAPYWPVCNGKIMRWPVCNRGHHALVHVLQGCRAAHTELLPPPLLPAPPACPSCPCCLLVCLASACRS
jgi:hypothetical protein